MDNAQIAQLVQRYENRHQLAGLLARVVADSLAEGDIEDAMAGLPAYLEVRQEADVLRGEMARLSEEAGG